MRSKLGRWLLSASLVTGTLIGTAAADPDVRDHRHGKGGGNNGGISVNGGVSVTIGGHADSGPPRSAPPAPRTEKFGGERKGFVWVAGYWDWRAGKWTWVDGHFEKRRKGKKWRERHWEQKGDQWVANDGDWVDADLRPAAAPPALREEKWQPRKGFVWVRGNWDWRDGEWTWVAGHWERERNGKKWRDPKWELQGGAWVMVNGDWIDAPAFPSAAPPAPQTETFAAKPGFTWVRGRWDWRNGDWQWVAGHWERTKARHAWQDGHWEQRGGQWTWIDGQWVAEVAPPTVVVAAYPTQPPPALQAETVTPRSGFVWVRGRWDWQKGNWAWVPGHWERAKSQQQWIDGRWEQRGGQWTWVEGNWQVVGAAGTPSAPVNIGPTPPVAPAPPPVAAQPPAPVSPPPGPTTAPPAPQTEQVPAARSGFVWVRGRWGWSGEQKYQWIPGHWERAKARMTWYDGKWEQRSQGGVSYWVWVEGGWR